MYSDGGFLKIRSYLDNLELIWYDRPTSPIARVSRYRKIELRSGDARSAAELLRHSGKKHGTVVKERVQYRGHDFLINIDEVQEVGYIVELELFWPDDINSGRVNELMEHLEISDHHLIPYSNIHLVNMFRNSIHHLTGSEEKGAMVFVDGGSATGKSTVRNKLVELHGFRFAARETTRAPRLDPESDRDYRFVTQQQFQIEFRDFLFGMSYGLPWLEFTEKIKTGQRTLALINLGSGMMVKQLFPDAHTVLLLADESSIRQRLSARGTMTEEQIEERVENANLSRRLARGYDLVLDTTAMDVEQVVGAILERTS
jgi:guanylate kinase/adenylate cyclase class IV